MRSLPLSGLRPTLLALSLAAIGLTAAMPSQAAVIHDLKAKARAVTTSSPVVNEQTGSQTVTASASDPLINPTSNAFAFGSPSGGYLTAASGSGTFSAIGTFSHSWTLTNDTSQSASYSLDVLIYSGGLSISGYGGVGQQAQAFYSLGIFRDGFTNLYDSSAMLGTENGTTLLPVTSGQTLNGSDCASATSSCSWNNTILVLDLGILTPGQSTTITYSLISSASGDSGNCVPSGYGYGETNSELTVTNGYGYGDCGSASAALGDPQALRPVFVVNSVSIPGASVSAPTSLALLGLGLGLTALPWSRRRRRS